MKTGEGALIGQVLFLSSFALAVMKAGEGAGVWGSAPHKVNLILCFRNNNKFNGLCMLMLDALCEAVVASAS